MAPGTVTVVKQVTEEEPSSNHTVMIQETLQEASVELSEQHHLVVSSDEVEGIGTVTVYTQGGEASELIRQEYSLDHCYTTLKDAYRSYYHESSCRPF
uniref:Uncharacterized protein n=1 Tax=Sphaerodactylus townsendi TaxID=933632 RepID=A0ACB8GF07_9SAUR